VPDTSLLPGEPAGSAVPLVWAHAEYLKLLRSAVDGKVFDRIDSVYERYCEREGQGRTRRNLEIYSLRRPIQKIAVGDTLRVLDGNRFDLVWSVDGWQTPQTVASRSLGSAGYSVDLSATDLATGQAGGRLSLTLHWPEQERWLGYNVEVKIEPK
jgi:glucoamylase